MKANANTTMVNLHDPIVTVVEVNVPCVEQMLELLHKRPVVIGVIESKVANLDDHMLVVSTVKGRRTDVCSYSCTIQKV
jgi:hypothetical protein